jgi:HK97 family phage prohead protease
MPSLLIRKLRGAAPARPVWPRAGAGAERRPARDLIAVEDFRAAARRGGKPSAAVFRVSVGAPQAVDEAARRLRYCWSDGSIDRAGDRIAVDGWNLENYLKNPVALWAHDSWSPPLGCGLNIAVEGDRLMGDIEFAAAQIYPFAETVYQLARAQFIRAVSVGFMPEEWHFVDDEDRGFGIDFIRQELLEISLCPIPCNPNALGEARAKGIDTRSLVAWAERALDGAGRVAIPRAELERLRNQAKEPRSMTQRTGTTGAQRRREGDGLSEGDPAAGGAVVGNCGRSKDEECGLKNPEECEIHRSAEDDKRLARLVGRAVADSLAPVLQGLGAGAPAKPVKPKAKPGRRKEDEAEEPGAVAENADDEDDGLGHEEHIERAAMHFKAAGECYAKADACHQEGMDHLERHDEAVDTIGGGEGDPEHNPEAERSAQSAEGDAAPETPHEILEAAQESFEEAAMHRALGDQYHEKGLHHLGKAVDTIGGGEGDPEHNPEAERAARLARVHRLAGAPRRR